MHILLCNEEKRYEDVQRLLLSCRDMRSYNCAMYLKRNIFQLHQYYDLFLYISCAVLRQVKEEYFNGYAAL